MVQMGRNLWSRQSARQNLSCEFLVSIYFNRVSRLQILEKRFFGKFFIQKNIFANIVVELNNIIKKLSISARLPEFAHQAFSI